MAQVKGKKKAKLKLPEIQAVKIADLKPHPNNPRVHPDSAIAALVNSIQSFGWTIPIIITKDNIILAGHARLKAAREAGYSEIPAIAVPLKGAQADAYMVADNRLAELTDWDLPVLKQVLEELDAAEIDLELMGFGQEEIDDLLGQSVTEIVEDEVPPIPEKAICRLGDLWLLGDHRLLCGDATVMADVEQLMGGTIGQMIFTDPPYGVGYEGGAKKRKKQTADEIGTDIYRMALPLLAHVVDEKSPLYLWYADGHAAAAAVADAGYQIVSQIIWAKNHAQFVTAAHYKGKHEPCYYAHRRGKAARWHGENNEVTLWEYDRSSRNDYHPTQKPVALSVRAIRNSTKRGQIVVDGFGGSGSTLIGCEQTGRVCCMVEIDPLYCDVIIQRWQNLTGRVAVNEKGEAWNGQEAAAG